jgi:hypothetical protein
MTSEYPSGADLATSSRRRGCRRRRAVLDDDDAERLLHPLGERARGGVERAARRIRHHEADRLGRIGLGGDRASQRANGERGTQCRKRAASNHVLSPSRMSCFDRIKPEIGASVEPLACRKVIACCRLSTLRD